ncbi:hypothetical protein BH24ACT5_BH24ACT5_17710 [soil metagenome]
MSEIGSGSRSLAGRYVLHRVLGRGGMATVYEGHDQRLDRRVAVKVVPVAGTEPTARQRFVQEAQSTARLFHPNIVALFDAGEVDGSLYIVMEFVAGRTLADEIKDRGRFATSHASTIAISVLAALDHAHRAGLVHRDVKPSNIMLADDGTVKLLDFGIAKRLDDLAGSLTTVGGIVGTPKYLAPEQVEGRPATPASDVYAVGVVLFEMLTGTPPFDGASPVATALAHAVAPVPDVSSLRDDLPETVVRALDTALRKDPAARFQTAAEMGEALTEAAGATSLVPGDRPEPRTPTMRMLPPPQPRDSTRPFERTRTSALARPREPTQIFPAGGYRRRRPAAWWLLSVAVLSVGAGVLIWWVSSSDPEESTAPPTATAGPAITTTVPGTTTVPATTTAPATTTTGAATTANPATVDGLLAALRANPDGYGPHADEIIKKLDAIARGGNKAGERAADLLEKVTEWVDDGEAPPAALSTLEAVLAPLIQPASDEDDDEENGNGNGNGND